MREIDGIKFDDQSYDLISQLIERLKLQGDFAVYGLPKMHAGRGEIRLAHLGRDAKRRKAKGVFCGFIPSAKSVSLAYCNEAGGKNIRTQITSENLDRIFTRVVARREFKKERLRSSEMVYPQPGMVSGGQFESDRRKH